jgi:hypothetical protein
MSGARHLSATTQKTSLDLRQCFTTRPTPRYIETVPKRYRFIDLETAELVKRTDRRREGGALGRQDRG